MLKVLKNLKESWGKVVIIVIFLCLQASADLNLPEYTSKIVNVGIQAGGIEEKVPKVISENDYKYLLKVSEEKALIENAYIFSKEDLNIEQEKIAKKYIGEDFRDKNVYILKDTENEQLKQAIMNPIIQYGTLLNEDVSNKVKDSFMANVQEEQRENLKDIDVVSIFLKMPEEQLQEVLKQYSDTLTKMPDSIKEQSVTNGIKEIYKSAGINTEKIQKNYLLLTGIKMLIVAFVSMTSAVIIILLSSKVAAKLGRTLREKVFKRVLSFSNKEFRELSTSSLITRTTNDVQQIQQLMAMLFRVLVYAPIVAIGGLFKVFNTNSSMVWIIGLAVFLILLVVGTLFIIAMPRFKKLQELIDKLNGRAREILTGIQVIRAFNKEQREEEKFEVNNTTLMKVNIFVNRAMSMMMPLMMLIMNGASVLVIWVGGHHIENGTMQVGDMMAFIQYMMQIVISFLVISAMSIMLPRASVSAKRIMEVLEKDPSIKDKEQTKELDKTKKGLVEFKNVSFRYPDADTEILEDVNFVAEPGKVTAIIGSTGSGKSTVVNLIPRFYDVTGGELKVDGINVKDIKQKELRDIIGFVPQRGILFSGTIESNIKYSSKDISDETMEEAAQIAQATEFINEKENKYNSEISQGGTNVSGGQKQRISIARALAKNPEILIFDDSFSALDFETDAKLREALAQKVKNKTVIIVAQRISTILNADQIIVLEEGKVVGKGTHKQLLENNEVYKQIALSQLSEKELGGAI